MTLIIYHMSTVKKNCREIGYSDHLSTSGQLNILQPTYFNYARIIMLSFENLQQNDKLIIETSRELSILQQND